MNKYFVVNIYKHQKYAIYCICIISTFCIFLSMFFPKDGDDNSFAKIYNLVGNIFFCFLIFFGFILTSFIIDFGRVLTKVLMDLNFISPFIIIIITGTIGFILNLLILFIVSKCKCINETILDKACLVKRENKKEKFFDNISIYFSELTEKVSSESGYTSKMEFYVEIFLIVPLFLVFSFFEFYFEIKIYKNLSPIYILIRDNLYYGLSRIVSFCINPKNLEVFILLVLAEIPAILGYSVYLEIIELRFCGLDNKLKRKLTETAKLESQVNMINIEEMEDSDDEDDKEDNNKITPSSNL